MPVVFFGHGSPMNTLERNQYTESWRKLGNSIPKPKAVLCVSAHWYTEGTAVTAMDKPKTIHDFYGFPQALFDVQYAAPGDPQLASRVRGVLIAGSGNVVHNLRLMKRAGGAPFDWAVRFNEKIRVALASRDHRALVDFEKLGDDARLSVPTPEHYLPLLYVAALQGDDEPMTFVVDGYDLGSVSMLTAVAGMPAT